MPPPFPGIPLVYMGDELGLDNDRSYLDDPEKADDSRWIHRPAMPWNVAARRNVQGSAEHRDWIAAQVRKSATAATTASANRMKFCSVVSR